VYLSLVQSASLISLILPNHCPLLKKTQQVTGKVNAISLDGCTRCGLLFDTVVSSCEIVNCKSVEVQCTGTAPTVAIDKTDGCQLYLSADALHADITTAKASEVNVIVPGDSEGDDPKEAAIPEQFVTRYVAGRFVTEPVSHSGG
jgi:adenylyl cyclase-associated protein